MARDLVLGWVRELTDEFMSMSFRGRVSIVLMLPFLAVLVLVVIAAAIAIAKIHWLYGLMIVSGILLLLGIGLWDGE